MKGRIKRRGVTYRSEFTRLYSKSSIILSVLVIIIGLGAWFFFVGFGGSVKCEDIDCYRQNLLECKKSWVFNEDENYVYRYEILNENGNSYCDVDVNLVRIKSGVSDNQRLESMNMVCKVNRFDNIKPEEDMLACSGRLREELQEIIIDRLHNQILQNLEEIGEAFEG